jgi:hypothetical protein
VSPAWSHTTLLGFTVSYRVSDKTEYLLYNYFFDWKNNEAIFSISGDTVMD